MTAQLMKDGLPARAPKRWRAPMLPDVWISRAWWSTDDALLGAYFRKVIIVSGHHAAKDRVYPLRDTLRHELGHHLQWGGWGPLMEFPVDVSAPALDEEIFANTIANYLCFRRAYPADYFEGFRAHLMQQAYDLAVKHEERLKREKMSAAAS